MVRYCSTPQLLPQFLLVAHTALQVSSVHLTPSASTFSSFPSMTLPNCNHVQSFILLSTTSSTKLLTRVGVVLYEIHLDLLLHRVGFLLGVLTLCMVGATPRRSTSTVDELHKHVRDVAHRSSFRHARIHRRRKRRTGGWENGWRTGRRNDARKRKELTRKPATRKGRVRQWTRWDVFPNQRKTRSE